MGTTAQKLQAALNSKAAIKTAIEYMGVTDVGDVLANYPDKIRSIKTGVVRWTGHADVEGLKAIGWTDEDIEYYQKNGVNWNGEDDEYHKVPQDNIDLYGVLTADNIQTYKDILVYCPKIDTSGRTDFKQLFNECIALVAIPQLDTSNATTTASMFYGCRAITHIPQLDTSNVINMETMFLNCYSLSYIPQLDTSKVVNMGGMFNSCYSLSYIPQLDTSNVNNMDSMFSSCRAITYIPRLNTSNVTSMRYMFKECCSLSYIPQLDTSKVVRMDDMFNGCLTLATIPQLDMAHILTVYNIFYNCPVISYVRINNLDISVDFRGSKLLQKDSLLYIINNEAATEPITITISTYCYGKYSVDADVTAALAAHPNVSLASA